VEELDGAAVVGAAVVAAVELEGAIVVVDGA
jgi:hypothetical protein